MRIISYANAINEAIDQSMELDKNLICFGLGTTDPKGIFGTTLGLEKKYGSERVFDMPTSENGMTGIAIGASLNGTKSIMTHQRLDFFLLAMDQLINSAAKWHYMFGSQCSIPITIRLILGRGWGQGPTHSQNLHAWFNHIPGLKVVMPASPLDAKGLLIESILDPNPVIFLEHRWLHNTKGNVPSNPYRVPIGKAKLLQKGNDISIISMSYLNIEALYAADYLKNKNISCDIIDVRSISPLDWQFIFDSVKKTGRILVIDSGFKNGSVAGEIITEITTKLFGQLKSPPIRLAMPDVPEPTSFGLTKGFYIRSKDIAQQCLKLMDENDSDLSKELPENYPHDIPGAWFTGPF